MADDEREAVILLQVDDVKLNEVKGPNRNPLDQGEMTVLRIEATPEELEQIGVAATESTQHTREVVFVLVGEHKIPIIKNVPILKKEEHRYTFVMPGLFLEMVMPDDVDPEEIEVLEELFKQNGVLKIRGQPQVTRTAVLDSQGDRSADRGSVGDRIAGGISAGAGKVVGVIQSTTPVVQGGIHKVGDKAVEHITPNENPTEIDEATRENIRKTRMATKTAVIVSGQMATGMVQLARALGKQLGSLAGETTVGRQVNSQDNPNVQEAKKVAAAGVLAASDILDAGTDAIKQLLGTSCDGLSKVVGHKFGDDAGATCSEGLEVVTDVYQAATNVRKVGVKGLAKAAGKQAGKEVLQGEGGASSSTDPPPQ